MGHEKHEKTRKKKVTTEHTENTEVEPQMNTDRHESGKTTENTEVGFAGLVGLFEQTQTAMQSQAARSVDIALVVRNWLFGWYIVEYQQSGSDRAEYEFPPGTGGSGESIHFDITVSGGDGGAIHAVGDSIQNGASSIHSADNSVHSEEARIREIIAGIKDKKMVPNHVMRSIIKELCTNRYLSMEQLASILKRNPTDTNGTWNGQPASAVSRCAQEECPHGSGAE
jgi:hypothetical protein